MNVKLAKLALDRGYMVMPRGVDLSHAALRGGSESPPSLSLEPLGRLAAESLLPLPKNRGIRAKTSLKTSEALLETLHAPPEQIAQGSRTSASRPPGFP